MTTTSTPTPFISRVIKNLLWVEGILLVLLVIGIILMALNQDNTLVSASLTGLAVVFFLYAYRPIDMPETNEKAGFSELLAYGILPKVMWISCAVATTGILFYILGMSGYKEMLMIGGLTIGVALLLFTIFLLTGVKHLRFLLPNLFRSVPLFLIVVYILMR
jgi:hypothetical protein